MYCGSPTEMAYHDGSVVVCCRECRGRIGESEAAEQWRIGESEAAEQWPIPADGIVGYVAIAPAGVYDRTLTEILDAAGVATVSDIQSIARGVFPGCSAPIDCSPNVCDGHDTGNRFCERCDHQFTVSVAARPTNCPFETTTPYPTYALGTVELVAFTTEHGVDPFVSDAFHLRTGEEETLSADPLEARYRFTADGDAVTLTVDDTLSTAEATTHEASDSHC